MNEKTPGMRIDKRRAGVCVVAALIRLVSACDDGTGNAPASSTAGGSPASAIAGHGAATSATAPTRQASDNSDNSNASQGRASGTGGAAAGHAGNPGISGAGPRGDAGGGGGGAFLSAGSSAPPSAGVGGVTTAAGAGGDSTGSEMCVKGQVKASEVTFIGTSVTAAGTIVSDTTDLARKAGVIGPNDSYRSHAVVGAQIIPDSTSPIEGIPSQFMSAVKEGPVKVVLMEGGINDLLWGGRCKNGEDDAPCMELVATVKTLFMTMQQAGVQDVVYFFYPDPGTFMGQDVEAATNTLRPKMQNVCEEATEVRCIFADPRPAWEGHYQMYTMDGIHPSAAGSRATAGVIWDAMVKNCVAQ